MNVIEAKRENVMLSDEDTKRNMELHEQFWKVRNYSESIIRQKERLKWNMEGYCYSKNFHNAVSWRRKKSLIKGLSIDGC